MLITCGDKYENNSNATSKLYVLAGWNGVVTLAVVSGAIALAIRLLENARIVAAERRAS
jgi:hypothetical protein